MTRNCWHFGPKCMPVWIHEIFKRELYLVDFQLLRCKTLIFQIFERVRCSHKLIQDAFVIHWMPCIWHWITHTWTIRIFRLFVCCLKHNNSIKKICQICMWTYLLTSWTQKANKDARGVPILRLASGHARWRPKAFYKYHQSNIIVIIIENFKHYQYLKK